MRNNRYFAYTDTHKIWPEESLDSMIEAKAPGPDGSGKHIEQGFLGHTASCDYRPFSFRKSTVFSWTKDTSISLTGKYTTSEKPRNF